MSEDFLLRETGAEVSVEWRIERFLYRPEEPDYWLDSPAFSLSDAQWFLVIWPHGCTTNDSVGWVSLYLYKRFSTSKKHTVKLTLGIRGRDGSVFKSINLESEIVKFTGHGCTRFVLDSALRQSEDILSADGSLTVFATFRLVEPTILDESNIVDTPQDVTFRVMRPEEVSTEWKVEGFTSLPKEEGFSLKSPTFSLAGAEWCLQLYPNGLYSDDLGWVCLRLRRERSSSEKQMVAFTLGIRKRNGTPYRLMHFEIEFLTNRAWGCRKFLKSSELLHSVDGLVHRGSVTLFCTIRVNPSPRAFPTLAERGTPASSHPRHEERASQTTASERDNHSQPTCMTLHENFRNLFVNELLGDVTVQVQRNHKIPAHMAILAARSSVFAAMFEHDTEERRTGIVNIDDFDAASFRAFMSFLYSADVEVVSADNAIPLYKAADKYNVQDLRSECLRYLQNGLSLESFFEVIQLAFMHSEQVLLDRATDFFLDNAKEIVVTPEWQAMALEHPALTNELVIKMASKMQ